MVADPALGIFGPRVVGPEALHPLLQRVPVFVEVVHGLDVDLIGGLDRGHPHRHPIADPRVHQLEPALKIGRVEQMRFFGQELRSRLVTRIGVGQWGPVLRGAHASYSPIPKANGSRAGAGWDTKSAHIENQWRWLCSPKP